MKNPHDIIIRPWITERTMDMKQDRKYVFIVDKRSNKTEIKHAIESVFKVKVVHVNTMNIRGKKRRMGRFEGKRPDWKKAIVTLSEDSKAIEFFDAL